MKNLFFTNPFLKYSEKTIFFSTSLITLLGTVLAYYSNVRFDGLLDVHQFEKITLWGTLKDNLFIIVVMTVLLFVFGKIINNKTRVIDVLNAVLVFRIPFYIICLLINLPFMDAFGKKVAENGANIQNLKINPLELASVMAVALLFLVLLGYAIWLLFSGFKTATNSKKTVHYIVFGLLIIVGEVLTKFFIYQL